MSIKRASPLATSLSAALNHPDDPAPDAILTRGINMTFYSTSGSFPVLQNVNLVVPQGKIQMVVGPSGAGKTTLLLIVAGLLTPTSGDVWLLGQNITTLSRADLNQFRRQNIGILFQESRLLRTLSAQENVEIALNLKGVQGREARHQARLILEAVGLGDRAHFLPRQLSGGQQQRVSVARALVGHPRLVIADEPTASLDSQNGQIVVELLDQLARNEGCTVLLATHDPRILDFADHLAYLEDGIFQKASKSQTHTPNHLV